MKAQRQFNNETQLYEVYWVPSNHEVIEEGIKQEIFQLTTDELVKLNHRLNEQLTLIVEQTQTPPTSDTIAEVLRKIIIKIVKERG